MGRKGVFGHGGGLAVGNLVDMHISTLKILLNVGGGVQQSAIVVNLYFCIKAHIYLLCRC